MRSLLLISLLAVAVPDREDPTPKDKPKPVQEQILGDWLCEKVGGANVAQNSVMVFRITPSETVFLVNGQPSIGDGLTATYSLDATKNPIAIDFMPRQRGGKMPGIMMLDGDTLTLGWRTSGDARPAGHERCIWICAGKIISPVHFRFLHFCAAGDAVRH